VIEATGVILAGGKSRRMGFDKAFLPVGREAMIERIAAELVEVFPEVLISARSEDFGRRLGIEVVPDLFTGGGPLSGIHAVLKRSRYPRCRVVACDMPFINIDLARFMVGQSKGFDVTVPKHGIYLQPLFAVYSKDCIPTIEKFLELKRNKVVDFYPYVRVNYVDETLLRTFTDIETAFFNVNTPADLEKARDLAEKRTEPGESIVKDPVPKNVCIINTGNQA